MNENAGAGMMVVGGILIPFIAQVAVVMIALGLCTWLFFRWFKKSETYQKWEANNEATVREREAKLKAEEEAKAKAEQKALEQKLAENSAVLNQLTQILAGLQQHGKEDQKKNSVNGASPSDAATPSSN